MGMRFALLGAMLLPIGAFAADLKFSGSLELLGRESVSIRLPDRIAVDARLPNTSSLSAATITAKYRLGDHVEIACKEINPILEDATGRLLFIELTRIRFVRTASPDELIRAFRLPAWREPLNLLLPADVRVPRPAAIKMNDPPVLTDTEIEAHVKLERAREVNLNYIAHLPNFVADETGKRYTGEARFPDWRYLDKIETEITVKGNRSDRQKVRRDGKQWKQPYQFLPGFKWSGGFGTELRPIFDLRCPTTIEYAGTAVMRGKRVLEYRFESPADGCFGPFTNEYARYNPARKGRVFVEDFGRALIGDRGGSVLQLEEEALDFPEQFEFSHRIETVSWDYVKIGDAPHLLPVAADFVVEYYSGSRVRVDVEYKNHRHFESTTSISFQ